MALSTLHCVHSKGRLHGDGIEKETCRWVASPSSPCHWVVCLMMTRPSNLLVPLPASCLIYLSGHFFGTRSVSGRVAQFRIAGPRWWICQGAMHGPTKDLHNTILPTVTGITAP